MGAVLVTRAMPEAEDTARDLAALGHSAILAPLRRVEAVMTPFPPRTPDGLVATSRNAFQHGTPFPPGWAALPMWCVGEKTAEAARGTGFSTVFAAGEDAVALAREILAREILGARPMPHRMLYLAGEPRGDALETALRAQGINLDVVLRYRMERLPVLPEAAHRALAGGGIDAVLHFSAESARTFFALADVAGLVEAARRPQHGCLSPAVADAVIDAAGQPLKTFLARERTSASLAKAVADEFR